MRGELTSLHRRIVAALITIDVHARDIVSDLVRRGTKVRHLRLGLQRLIVHPT